MIYLVPNSPRISSNLCSEPPRGVAILTKGKSGGGVISCGGSYGGDGGGERGRKRVRARLVLRVRCSNLSAISATEDLIEISEKNRDRNEKSESVYLANEYGWKVRKLIEEEDDLMSVARIQAEAFHEPVLLFNQFFYQFFKAEVLSALIYRLKNYPPNRYACLVAEPENETCGHNYEFVGVVDVTVAGDLKVKRHLPAGEDEYLFVSGIAVCETVRRRKVATVLLKGCDVIAKIWGIKYLALSAYEDDDGARNLYSKAGYHLISSDPLWKSSWIGRKRCITMLKKL